MVYTCDKGACNVKERAKLALDHHSDSLWVKICICSVVQSHNALSADFTSRLLTLMGSVVSIRSGSITDQHRPTGTFFISPSVYTFKYKVAC